MINNLCCGLSGTMKFMQLWAILIVLSSFNIGIAQTGSVKGTIEDAATGETLVGATVLIQGTNKGTITDMDGNYQLNDIAQGTYNLVISYVSYEQQIQRVEVRQNTITELSISLTPSSVEMDAVKIIASKRNDTEMSLISTMRVSSLVANGISRQQISRSQDKDASEVI